MTVALYAEDGFRFLFTLTFTRRQWRMFNAFAGIYFCLFGFKSPSSLMSAQLVEHLAFGVPVSFHLADFLAFFCLTLIYAND